MKSTFRNILLTLCAISMMAGLSWAGTLKVGVQAPITGDYANEGQGIENAARLVADEFNANGGILGQQIEVIPCDDQGTAMAAAICAKDLVNKGVSFVVGSYTSTCAAAAQKTYYNAGVLQTSDGTSDALISEDNHYWTFLRNSFPNSAEADYAAEYMINVKNYKRIVVVSDFSSYATGLAESVIDALKAAGGNVVAYKKIKAKSQNFTPVLTSIKSKNPDAIFFAGYYSDGGQLRAQQVALRIDADFIGGDANDNVDFAKLAGSAAEGAFIINVPTPEMLPYDIAKTFLKNYKTTYGTMPPSVWTLMNADGMRIILHAMKEAKTTDTKKVFEYLMAMDEPLAGVTGPLQFAKDGNRVGSSYMTFEIKADKSYKVVHAQ
ncbi:MAG: branched-chain amino acid ABC transporter substrate-binding protein [Thermodesulfobacteriota bacterium]|nr:branched-chain amino acid ABC transporter substrate-binding protein [Thermodesulfobacteriota bacterium]